MCTRINLDYPFHRTMEPIKIRTRVSMTLATVRTRCPLCQKLFTNSENRRFHILTEHAHRKDYQLPKVKEIYHQAIVCSLCQRNFENKELFLRHIRTIHNKPEESIVPKEEKKLACTRFTWVKWKPSKHKTN